MYQHLKSTSLMIVLSGFCLLDNCHFLQSGDGCCWREHSWTRHVLLSYPCIGLLSCNSPLLVCFSFCMSPLCSFPSCEHLWFALGSFLMVLLNGCFEVFYCTLTSFNWGGSWNFDIKKFVALGSWNLYHVDDTTGRSTLGSRNICSLGL